MTSSDRSKTFCCVKCVSKPSASGFRECWMETASHGEAYCLSSHCLTRPHIHLRPVPSLIVSSSRLSSVCQANRFSRALIPGSVFTFFLCPVTSSNLANTNLTSNNRHCGAACQFRCAPLHPGPLWLRLSLALPLSVSLAGSFSACRAPVSQGLHHGTLHLTHASTHSLICNPVFIPKHSGGVVCCRRGIVR